MDTNNSNETMQTPRIAGVVHVLLSQDYAVFFLAVVLGVLFDLVFSVHILNGIIYEYIGLIFIFFGTAIIYWAQSTTRKMGKRVSDNRDISFFLHGPYKYTRNPTNFGLTIAIVGFGLLINSFFSIVWIIITYLISKFFFIKRQDEILKERYGDVFLEYKKKVKDWI